MTTASDTAFSALLRYFDHPASSEPAPISHPDHSVNQLAQTQLESLRSAAVLLPITRETSQQSSELVLTVRAAHLKSHAGQVSLPGGTTEEQDPDSRWTALRESEEEIGLSPDRVEIIGQLGDMALPSGFHVTPIVGLIDHGLDYVASPDEVADIFHAPLELVLDRQAYSRSTVPYQDRERTILELQYGDYRIWGATAAILYHLAKLIDGHR